MNARVDPRQLPERLLSRSELAAILGIHPNNVSAYVRRWPTLVAAARVVRARDDSKRGLMKYLESAVMRHVRDELA